MQPSQSWPIHEGILSNLRAAQMQQPGEKCTSALFPAVGGREGLRAAGAFGVGLCWPSGICQVDAEQSGLQHL